jgi:hypothetical protein
VFPAALFPPSLFPVSLFPKVGGPVIITPPPSPTIVDNLIRVGITPAPSFAPYFNLCAPLGTFWNGTGFEIENDSHWASYVITMTALGTSGIFNGTTPPTLPAGSYDVDIRVPAASTPAPTDTIQGSGSGYWDGTNWQSPQSMLLTYSGIEVAGVVSDSAPSPTAFKATGLILSAVSGFYVGQVLKFTGGTGCPGASALVTGYVGTTKQFTFGPTTQYPTAAPLPASPSNGDPFGVF